MKTKNKAIRLSTRKAKLRSDLIAWLLMIPSLILFSFFVWGPLVDTVKMSFYQTKGMNLVKFTLGKLPNRTVKGGARPALLTIPIHAPPGQADNSYLLTKINGVCYSDSRPRQSSFPTKRGCYL